jgi:hypothetical protein
MFSPGIQVGKNRLKRPTEESLMKDIVKVKGTGLNTVLH